MEQIITIVHFDQERQKIGSNSFPLTAVRRSHNLFTDPEGVVYTICYERCTPTGIVAFALPIHEHSGERGGVASYDLLHQG